MPARKTSPSSVRLDVPMEPAADLTKQYRRLEIHLVKRVNEFSGLTLVEPESHRHRGVLFVQGIVPSSFAFAHNVRATEDNLADGFLPQDMIAQVDCTTGPPWP